MGSVPRARAGDCVLEAQGEGKIKLKREQTAPGPRADRGSFVAEARGAISSLVAAQKLTFLTQPGMLSL